MMQGVGVKLGGFLPTQMMLTNWYKKGAGKAIGIVGSMDNLVSAVYIIGVAAMFVSMGWRASATVQALCVLIPGLIAGIFFVRYSPIPLGMTPVGATDEDVEAAKKASAGKKVEVPGLPFSKILRSPVFFATIVILVLQTFVMMYFISNQALIMTENGMSTIDIGIAVSAFSVTNVINKILFGFVVDKKGVRVAAMYCYIGVFASVFVLMDASTVLMAIIYSVLYGLIGGPLTMVGIFTAQKMFGQKDIQLTTSFFQAATALGGILGPIVIVALKSINGSYMIPTVFCAATIVVCMALVLIFLRPKYYLENRKDVPGAAAKVVD
jgi:sugar phosphate permease